MSKSDSFGSWSLVESSKDGFPLLVRIRAEIKDLPSIRESHPLLIKVTWEFGHDSISGMPSAAEEDAMQCFENLLVPRVEADFSALLTIAVTYDGNRSWYFYSSNSNEFTNRLNDLPQTEERMPIVINKRSDEDWEYYGAFMRDFLELAKS